MKVYNIGEIEVESLNTKELEDKQEEARKVLNLLYDSWCDDVIKYITREGNTIKDLSGNVFILKKDVEGFIPPQNVLEEFTDHNNTLYSDGIRMLIMLDCLESPPLTAIEGLKELCFYKTECLNTKHLSINLSLFTVSDLANLSLYQCDGVVVYGGEEFINKEAIDKYF